MSASIWRAVLFDLDGTLLDSAPDLVGALNRLLIEEQRPPLAPDRLRQHISSGSTGLICVGFAIDQNHPELPRLRRRFLSLYTQYLCNDSVIFEGIPPLLNILKQRSIPWGIVTNKHRIYTEPLLEELSLTPHVLVCGDDLKPKPAPDGLLYAQRALGIAAQAIVYVGDDLRDIQAAHAAGIPSVAAAYGYLGEHATPEKWGADYLVKTTQALTELILQKTILNQ